MSVAGVRHWQAGVPGDGADARRGAARSDPQAEVLLGEGSQCRFAHHHQDCGISALAGGEDAAHWVTAVEGSCIRIFYLISFFIFYAFLIECFEIQARSRYKFNLYCKAPLYLLTCRTYWFLFDCLIFTA